ncbi:MAG: beta-lactamase family protein [Bacteroidia bacterium]|nr:beta-lactamase family protein [Bacteroidia bacterium]
MGKSKLNLLFFTFLLFVFACRKEVIEINSVADFEQYLQDEMKDQHIPAMSVLIFEQDQILYEGYLGKSNLAQNKDLTANDLFLLASVSKTVTATALLQLYDQGAFQLDDKINDYLSFAVHVPNHSTDITFRMLLTHTSAIADGSALDDQYYYGMDSPVALSSFMQDYLVPGGQFYDAKENFYDFEPGSAHEYSNEGNALIAVLVEEISGMNFNAYCKQHIFTPMGMTNSFWRLDEINQTIAQPYDYSGGKNHSIEHYTFTDYPNGGLRSNVGDMFKFLSSFTQNGFHNGYQLLEPGTVTAMITPQIPNLDPEVGLHMFLMDAENNLWGHDGGEQGVATIMAFNPGTKVGALIFTNQGEADLTEILSQSYQFGLKL